MQRPACLREREVERRGLVAPVAEAADHVSELGFAAGPLLERVEVRAERAERPLAGEREVGTLRLEEQRDVLAQPLVPGAGEAHEPRRVGLAEPRARVEPPVPELLHDERQFGELGPVVHRDTLRQAPRAHQEGCS